MLIFVYNVFVEGVDMFVMFFDKERLFLIRIFFEDEFLFRFFLLWFVFLEFLEVFVVLEVVFFVTWLFFVLLVSVVDEFKK